MPEQLLTIVSEFRGKPPEVPLAPGVQLEDFDDPFFTTLKIGRVGATSKNGRVWGLEEVQRVVSEVNQKRPEGILGHIEREERGSRYDLPSARWVGAVIDAEGVAWGKAYIPKYAEDVREFIRDAARTHAKVGLSVYGTEGVNGLKDMDLESIDFGHPSRLGVVDAAAVPIITAELHNQTEGEGMLANTNGAGGGNGANDATPGGVVSEMTTLINERARLEKIVSELEPLRGMVEQIRPIVAEMADGYISANISLSASGDNLPDVFRQLVDKLSELKAGELQAALGGQVAELVQVEAMRPLVGEMLGLPTDDMTLEQRTAALRSLMTAYPTVEAGTARITAIMEKPYMQALAKSKVVSEMGPAAITGVTTRDNAQTSSKEQAVANAVEIARQIGI